MNIGPITIRRKEAVRAEQSEAQRLSMVRSRLIVRLRADNQALRHTLEQILNREALRTSKPPKGVGVAI